MARLHRAQTEVGLGLGLELAQWIRLQHTFWHDGRHFENIGALCCLVIQFGSMFIVEVGKAGVWV